MIGDNRFSTRASPEILVDWNDGSSRTVEEAKRVESVWSFEYSVDCAVSKDTAWRYWTNVKNWVLDVDVESVALDGPFEAGTHGVTMSKSSGPIEWRISDIQPGRAVLEFPAPGALATFVWTFVDSDTGTKITQRANLSGPDAARYVDLARALETGIPAGMLKLCGAMHESMKERRLHGNESDTHLGEKPPNRI